jgi:hypothetical protein
MVMTVATVTMTVKADYAWGGINHALATRNGHVAGAGRARPAPPPQRVASMSMLSPCLGSRRRMAARG